MRKNAQGIRVGFAIFPYEFPGLRLSSKMNTSSSRDFNSNVEDNDASESHFVWRWNSKPEDSIQVKRNKTGEQLIKNVRQRFLRQTVLDRHSNLRDRYGLAMALRETRNGGSADAAVEFTDASPVKVALAIRSMHLMTQLTNLLALNNSRGKN